MERNEYLRMLHDLAYQANYADVPDRREAWQKPEQAATHCQPLLDMVRDVLGNENDYQAFLDCFGDFDSFLTQLNRK